MLQFGVPGFRVVLGCLGWYAGIQVAFRGLSGVSGLGLRFKGCFGLMLFPRSQADRTSAKVTATESYTP